MWLQATQRARDQRRILRGLADIVHARNAKLAEMQKDTEEGGVPEKQQTPEASPWRREPAEAHRYFRPPGDGFNWATAAKDFPGGERGLKSVAHFCADLQWEDSGSTPAAQGTWMELALDYEVATGETISARRSARRWQDKSKPELRGGLSAAQKAEAPGAPSGGPG